THRPPHNSTLFPYTTLFRSQQHWPAIREQLLSGNYAPKPVRRVEIAKPDGGGMRKLGIPTALDRFVQQALLQVLQRLWDPTFSRSEEHTSELQSPCNLVCRL